MSKYRDLTPAECQQLELLLDATSLQAVLEALSTICGEKGRAYRHALAGCRACARLALR